MAALTSTDVTVTISQRNVEDRPGLLRRVIADLAFGDGTSTYPTGGVPLPAIGQFGFRKAIAIGLVEEPVASNSLYNWRYDRSNHTLMACGASEFSTPSAASKFYEVATTMAPPATTVRVMFF